MSYVIYIKRDSIVHKIVRLKDSYGVGNIADVRQDRSLSHLMQSSIIRNTKIKL
jgi:hypothetical protein